MAGIITAVSAVSKIIETISGANSNMSEKELGDLIKKTAQKTQLIMTDGSITKLLSDTIVEPVAIVSKSLRQEDIVQKVLELNTDIFTGFYMQAYEILKNLYGQNSQTAVKLLGTDNSSIGGVMKNMALDNLPKLATLSHESFDFMSDLTGSMRLSIEMTKDEKDLFDKQAIALKELNAKEAKLAANFNKDKNDSRNELYGAVLQRSIELTLSVNVNDYAHKIILPMTIKTHVIFTDIESVIRMLAPNNHDKSFTYRLDEYMSGGIGLSDLIFASDLINEYKQNKLKDKDGLISLLNQRSISANTKAVNGGVVGYEKYYNMFVISSDDQIKLEKQLGGKLNNEAYKQRFLSQGGGLLLTIIDQDYERVIMFTKDIRGTSDLSFKALQKRNSKSNDFEEIIKAVLTNRSPVF